MVYLQIVLLLLIVLTQVLRSGAIARWDRLWKAKLYLAISVGTPPVLMLLSRMGMFGRDYMTVMPWGAIFEGVFFTVAVSFYLFCLRVDRATAAGDEK